MQTHVNSVNMVNVVILNLAKFENNCLFLKLYLYFIFLKKEDFIASGIVLERHLLLNCEVNWQRIC